METVFCHLMQGASKGKGILFSPKYEESVVSMLITTRYITH